MRGSVTGRGRGVSQRSRKVSLGRCSEENLEKRWRSKRMQAGRERGKKGVSSTVRDGKRRRLVHR